MAGTPETPPAIPPDALPVPVVGVTRADGEAVITTVNDAFLTRFGDAEGMTVAAWLAATAAPTATATAEAAATLRGADIVETTLRLTPETEDGPTRYRLQAIGRPDTGVAYTLLTDRGSACRVEVDRLASVISHDLRNPLDVADAHLQAARETGATEHFDQLAAAHDRMARIIQDVLTLARGEDALNTVAAVDIADVAADAWATVDTENASLSIGEALPTLSADADRLQRLFENLFRNAVEHGTKNRTTDETPLTVTVGRDGDGFFIADDGVGIPSDDREQIFESGYVCDDNGLGTGLGLTIVEEIADAHEWTVSVTDSAAGGARFEFHPRGESSPT